MPRRALSEKRPFLLLSIVAAAAYFYLRYSELPELYLLAVKASAVGLLAVYAYLRHQSADARLLVWIMALSALGDVVISYHLLASGFAFFLSHIFALTLFLRNPRPLVARSQKAFVVSIMFLVPAVAWLLPSDRDFAMQVAIYAMSLGGMAASAWASNFPRSRVGAGALLFVFSDIILFAELGPFAGSPVPDVFIWPTYYLGQFLICTGVIQTLRKRNPELKVVVSN